MIWEPVLYYAGFLMAILLCWNLGPLFAIPMVLDLSFDILLSTVGIPGWLLRWMMLGYGLAIFLWVIALSGAFTRSMFVALTCIEVVIVASKLWAPLQVTGIGFDFWNHVCSSIYDIWLMSIFVAVASVAVKSSIVAKFSGKRVDILTNPRKRFILPIGIWAAIIVLPGYFAPHLREDLLDSRYKIAAQALVWGWIAFELPFYIVHRRLMRALK